MENIIDITKFVLTIHAIAIQIYIQNKLQINKLANFPP